MKKVYVIGLGPGGLDQATIKAKEVLEESDIIVGYTVYVDLIKENFPEKKYLTTPMKQEVRRCEMALEEASAGYSVSIISSGDAGVYGMAGLVYQLSKDFPEVEVEVVSGVTAACSGGAVLGSPLTNDFAVISLSNLLTPWEVIEQRLELAAQGDFSVCLYNPSSKKRKDHLEKACDILLKYRGEETVCGIVQHIGREGENHEILTLKELRDKEVDMFTTVFIGGSLTEEINGKMVTPRGYFKEGTNNG